LSGRTTLLLEGARSGKTRRALALAEPFAQPIYMATAEALDAEMADRIGTPILVVAP
jgi:adenosylcobinamide kinase/adenosylcobinamide-phosphate guanylyltransferase